MNSGIYQITHKNTGRFYIGSTVNLTKRERIHRQRLLRGNHHNVHLQEIATAEGVDAFEWEILELCPLDELKDREQVYLDKFVGSPQCINIAKDAMAPTRGLKLPLTEIQKVRIGMALKGKPKTEEHRQALSNAARTRKRRSYDVVAARKISQSQRKYERPSDDEMVTMTFKEWKMRYPDVSPRRFYEWRDAAKRWKSLENRGV